MSFRCHGKIYYSGEECKVCGSTEESIKAEEAKKPKTKTIQIPDNYHNSTPIGQRRSFDSANRHWG